MDRSTLVQQCTKQPHIFKFICQLMREAIQDQVVFHTLVAFFVATVTAYLEQLPRIEENTILAVLPYISECMRCEDNTEVQVGPRYCDHSGSPSFRSSLAIC